MTVSFERLDQSTLRDILALPGPVATVYAGRAPEVAEEYQLDWPARWRPIGENLRRTGADDASVAALEGAVASLASARAAHAMTEVAAFAAAGRVLGVFPAPGADWADWGGSCAPAHVVPLLRWAQERPPYVVVVTDRAGAEVEAFAGAGAAGHTYTVRGPDDAIEVVVPPGFTSQRRVRRRAEDSWRHNAAAVAEATARALERVGARLLVVSGDVRAVRLLEERLPERIRLEVTVSHIRGSRAADGSQHWRAEAVAELVHRHAARERSRLLHELDDHRGPGGLGVEGEEPTLQALAAARVRTLLVAPTGADDPRQAWFGNGGPEVLTAARPRPPWSRPRRGPLLDVAVRSAALTGADVRVVPWQSGAPAEGLGGICRYR
ncbi:MAG TPA: hypothetical protein VF049_00735 [Nocardioidaceae bacterium]